MNDFTDFGLEKRGWLERSDIEDGGNGRVDGMVTGGAGEPSAKRAKADEAKEEEDPLVRRKEELILGVENARAEAKRWEKSLVRDAEEVAKRLKRKADEEAERPNQEAERLKRQADEEFERVKRWAKAESEAMGERMVLQAKKSLAQHLPTVCVKLEAKNEKLLGRLPPEMWQKILDENVQQKDLFALAVTCRFFRDTSDVVGLARAKRLSGTLEGPTPIMRDIEFTLYIETSNTAPQAGMLLNRFEEADSVITQLHAGPIRKIDRSHSELVELSADEKAQPGFIGKILTLESIWKNDEGHIVDTTRCVYEKSKGFFTVAEVVASVEAYERIDRPKTKWFGGVDCHHVFFEGLFPNANKDAYGIFWGS